MPPVPERAAGLRALDDFLPMVGRYAAMRNFDIPGHPGVSGLSPYTRHRMVLEREIIAAVLKREGFGSAQKFIEEVCWRTYWKGWLELHPSVWRRYLANLESVRSRLAGELASLYARACAGETHIACFNHWARELTGTGYLHNHARMWFASIWIFTLRLPWELGADFFLRHLLDGDPAANTLSWRWVAGLHTKGKAYAARAANIAKFTEGRFHPERQLNESPEPLHEDFAATVLPLRPCASVDEARLPTLSASPAGLLILDEDLAVEESALGECPFSSVACFVPTEIFGEMGYAPNVRRFREAALGDAARRACQHWAGSGARLLGTEELAIYSDEPPEKNVSRPTAMRVFLGPVDDWVRAVLLWTKREHLKAVRLMAPPVGPYSARIARLRAELVRQGVLLIEHRRRWDEVHWPHTKGGYFAFRRGLEDRFVELGLSPSKRR